MFFAAREYDGNKWSLAYEDILLPLPFFVKLFLIMYGGLPSQQIFTFLLYQTLTNINEWQFHNNLHFIVLSSTEKYLQFTPLQVPDSSFLRSYAAVRPV